MKALITGGTGFAGSFLAEYLSLKGFDVAVTGLEKGPDLTAFSAASSFRFFAVDVCDEQAVFSVIRAFRPERLYHLAAQSNVPYSFRCPKHTFEVNVFGTINVLEAVAKLAPNCRVLVTCSAEEYGLVDPSQNPINEMHPLRPSNPYAVSKVAQDMVSFQYHITNKLYVVRVRAFNHIGPRQSPSFVVSSFAKQVAEIEVGKRKPILKVGNLDAQRDFTDVRDVVKAYSSALESLPPGSVANVCSGRAIRIAEVLRILLSKTTATIRVEKDPALLRPLDAPVIIGDPSYIRKTTGWVPTIDIEQSIADTLDYWRTKVRQDERNRKVNEISPQGW